MRRNLSLPEDVWGRILHQLEPYVLVTLKKVSKSMRKIVRIALMERWHTWRSKAGRPIPRSRIPAELGDKLDNMLFLEICTGNNVIKFSDLRQNERKWLDVR